jgi:hypothetical protein
MPGYAGKGRATLLRSNQQAFLFQNEIPTVPSLSLAVQLERISHSFYPWGASFEVWFSGNPGAFEIDFMGANDDSPERYLSLGSVTTATGSTVSGQYVARFDMPTADWPKFVAAYIKTLTNSVQVNVQVTR